MNTELWSGLRVRGEIKVDTTDGQGHIELLFGDITKLPPEEKMDVVMVSAFPGDYLPIPGTLIGALKHNLDLSVHYLAQDRQEDLRKHFNCWWSKPLPEHLPYRQLLCFETPFRQSFRHPAELIGDVFRCLVPMFGNEAKTVITPLLSTGDQGFSKVPMICALLDGAINWIRAGLPLEVLRIVVYAPNITYVEKEDEEVIKFFEKYKKTVEAAQRQLKDPDLHYDVYMSYSEEDEGRVKKIVQLLREEKSDLKIFSKRQHLNVEEAWQDDIYNTMTQCKSIVTFLSPNYLSSRECVEQFNIALVCDRVQKRVLLTPFLLESIVGMPTYMELVQYVDCRDRGDNNVKMMKGLKDFIAMFQLGVKQIHMKTLPLRYNVFISYCHRNEEKAAVFLETLQKLDPKMNIFFDRIELKVGSSWQQALYYAIDISEVLISVITKGYLASTICREEYDLALCKHIAPGHDLELIPILIEDLDVLPYTMSKVPIIDGRHDFNGVVATVCKAAVEFVQQKGKNLMVFNLVDSPMDISEITTQQRKGWFLENFTSNLGILEHKEAVILPDETRNDQIQKRDKLKEKETLSQLATTKITAEDQRMKEHAEDRDCDGSNHPLPQPVENDSKFYDVAFVYADDDREAFFLNEVLKYFDPNVTTNFRLRTERTKLASVEHSRIVVTLLSPGLVHSSQCMDEINIALARHRKKVGRPVLYPIQIMNLPKFPTYLHTLPCRIAIQDMLWWYAFRKNRLGNIYIKSMSWEAEKAREKTVSEVDQDVTEHAMLALTAAALDIIATLQNDNAEDPESKNVVIDSIVRMSAQCMSDVSVAAAENVPIAHVLKTLPQSLISGPGVPPDPALTARDLHEQDEKNGDEKIEGDVEVQSENERIDPAIERRVRRRNTPLPCAII